MARTVVHKKTRLTVSNTPVSRLTWAVLLVPVSFEPPAFPGNESRRVDFFKRGEHSCSVIMLPAVHVGPAI